MAARLVKINQTLMILTLKHNKILLNGEIFISFVNGISGTMVSDNGHLDGHFPWLISSYLSALP